MSCTVCGGPEREKLRVRGVGIRQCGVCGLARWCPPAGFAPEAVYDAGYFGDEIGSEIGSDGSGDGGGHGYDDYGALEAGLRRTFARRLARLTPPREGARLLDVGAAFGFAVRAAGEAGWRAVGVEISRAAARRAQAAAPGRVARASALRTPFPDACFDAVTAWDVIEHLPDPHAAAAELARVLRPGGRLVLTTGDVESLAARLSGARWHLYTLPEHLWFFSRGSLERLLGRHGLRVEGMRCEAAHYTLGYLAERLRKTLLGRPGTPARAPRWPGARLAVPVNLLDILTVRAVRIERDATVSPGTPA